MVEVERVRALADLIEKQPHTFYADGNGFNMNILVHSCGTPACIAGWSYWESQGRPAGSLYDTVPRNRDSMYLERVAAEYIGYDVGDGTETDDYPLFYPPGTSYDNITPAQAAKVLRHFADTGVVDWSIVGVGVGDDG